MVTAGCQTEAPPTYSGPDPLIACGERICINPDAEKAWLMWVVALKRYARSTYTLCKGDEDGISQ